MERTIAEIQGDDFVSPDAGLNVTTRGVVSTVYTSGGLSGFYMQTEGTGGVIDLDDLTTVQRHLRLPAHRRDHGGRR